MITGQAADHLLRGLLAAIGAVGLSTGAAVAWHGPQAIPGGAATVPSNDSVLRFYAVWWSAAGFSTCRLALVPDLDARQLRAVAATTFLGGLARLASLRRSGRPHPLFQALTVTELLLPPGLLALHRLIERNQG